MSCNVSEDDQYLQKLTTEIEHLIQKLAHLRTMVHHPEDTPSVFEQRKALRTRLYHALEARDARVGISGIVRAPAA